MTRCCMSLYFAFKGKWPDVVCPFTLLLKANDPMLYVPLLCFQHLCPDKYPFLMNIYRKTIASSNCRVHADLVTCIEHLAFWFYKYHQNSRSSVVSYITPTLVASLLLCSWSKRQQTAQKNMIITRDLFTKQNFRSQYRLTVRSWEIIYVEYM